MTVICLDTAAEQFGQLGGLSTDGNFMFGALVLIVNVKVINSAYEYTFWFLLTVFVSVGSFYVIFGFFSVWQFMTTTGQLQHTYNLVQTYLILTFFMFSYVLID